MPVFPSAFVALRLKKGRPVGKNRINKKELLNKVDQGKSRWMMAQLLCIGLCKACTNLHFGTCAIYFDHGVPEVTKAPSQKKQTSELGGGWATHLKNISL